MTRKFRFYERYGVAEYYLYNPDTGELGGWQRQGDTLEEIAPMVGWVSPHLGIRFEIERGVLQLYRPDGERFVTYVELVEQREQERQRAERLAARLRAAGVRVDLSYGDRGIKGAMRAADRSGASIALVAGDRDIEAGKIGVKNLATGEQVDVPVDAVLAEVLSRLSRA